MLDRCLNKLKYLSFFIDTNVSTKEKRLVFSKLVACLENRSLCGSLFSFFNKYTIDLRIEKILAPIYVRGKKCKPTVITPFSSLYPKSLLLLNDAPWFLLACGDVSLLKKDLLISIVGTRSPSSYGIEVVKRFIPSLVMNGFITVSGMALGVDSIVHQETLNSFGKTIAVLGTPLNKVYPVENLSLFYDILEKGGLILTEYVPFRLVKKYFFSKRNRIIAAIGKSVFVVEAPKESGALITAKYASLLSKDLITVPSNIFNQRSKGNNILIKNGAIPVTDVKDILELYGVSYDANDIEQIQRLIDKEGFVDILDAIPQNGITINSLVSKLGLPYVSVINVLERLKDLSLVVEDDFGVLRKNE